MTDQLGYQLYFASSFFLQTFRTCLHFYDPEAQTRATSESVPTPPIILGPNSPHEAVIASGTSSCVITPIVRPRGSR